MNKFVGVDGGVCMATGYGLDSPGIESQWRRIFPDPSGLILEPTQPSVQEIPGIFPENRFAGAWR